MPNKDGKSNIIAISKNPLILESVNAAFKGDEDFLILDNSTIGNSIEDAIAKLQAEIILIDFDYKMEGTYDLIDRIATDFPTSAVIAILPEEKVQFSDKVILSGARAFMLYPFTTKNLQTTTKRVVELLKRNFPTLSAQDMGMAAPVKPKNTYTIFSPKGGSGCSTVAVNLSICLRQFMKEPLLLVDGKHLFGHVSLMLNLRTANSITDLISHAGLLDQHLINQVVVDHVSGIKVLPSPVNVVEGQGIRPEDLYKVIVAMQETFPVIIVDGGNYLSENTVTYMDASDKIIVVMNPNLASIRDVKQFLDLTRTLSYPPEKMMLVLNNTGHKADLRKEEIETILKHRVICTLPGDENMVVGCMNEGIPIVLKNSHHAISKGIQELAKIVYDQIIEVNLAYKQLEKKTSADLLAKSSRLG